MSIQECPCSILGLLLINADAGINSPKSWPEVPFTTKLDRDRDFGMHVRIVTDSWNRYHLISMEGRAPWFVSKWPNSLAHYCSDAYPDSTVLMPIDDSIPETAHHTSL